jgi:predicted DCC family thiol-disulfide oxidoreductase YuxK
MAVGRIRLLLVLMVLSLGLWIVFAKLVVPTVVESVYRGESWSFLDCMIRGKAMRPMNEYLDDWNRVALRGLLSGLGFWLIVLVISAPAFVRRIVGEATPGSLGAIRMWTCLVLLLGTVREDLPSIALLPVEMRQPVGLMQYFSLLPIGFERLVTSGANLRLFQWLTELLLFLGVVGWRTRLVMPLGALCTCVFWGILRDYSFFWHQNLVPLYVMAVLSWTPCGDGWSVDRMWKVYRGQAVPDADRGSLVYGWSRYACWVVIALPYVAAGMSKLRGGGLLWWDATNMRRMLYAETLKMREFDWTLSLHLSAVPDLFFNLLGLFAVLGELFFGLVLFFPIARWIFPVVMMLTHIGILGLQKILFLDLILLMFVFFDFRRIRQAIGERLAASRGRIQVLYDGLRPHCRRSVRLLSRFDLFSRLHCLDFRSLNLTDYNRSPALHLTPQDLEAEMYVIARGRAYRGLYGYRTIALALPAFWPLAPWLFLPGISTLGASLYGYIARNRLKLLWCDSHCALQSSEESGLAGVANTNDPERGFRYALAVSGVMLVLLHCWFYRIEFYPFTAMQMFSHVDSSGVIYYFKVLTHRESGATAPARFEDDIGMMARNGRYGVFIQVCERQLRLKDVYMCEKVLHAIASAHNNARPGDKITKYEIQVWEWDFRSNPSDPNHGNVIRRVIFEINSGEQAQEKRV